MTSKIKVDNINKVSDDSNIINKCGTNITMGQNGDTVIIPNGVTEQVQSGGAIQVQSGGSITIASGATITNNGTAVGLGRTGTVDWITASIKTSTFTAANGEGYFANTAGGTFEMDLPAGSTGAIVSIQDYNNTFDTNALTVDPNGSEKINGGAAGQPVILNTEGRGVTFVYIDATVGWRSVQDNDFTKAGEAPTYVAASGGTESTVGDFKFHKFTGPGTFTVSNAGNSSGSNTVQALVVAGGAGGTSNGGGGGGAGGLRNLACQPVTATGFPITVGAGGSNGGPPQASPGNSSVYAGSTTITSAGGGAGGTAGGGTGDNGGSGGGAGGNGGSAGTGGSGDAPPTNPSQGSNGGSHGPQPNYNAGSGGGGHSQAGGPGEGTGSPGKVGGTGGNGTDVSPSFPAPLGGTPAGFYAGGGGGGGNDDGGGTAPDTPNAPGGGGEGAGGSGQTAGSGVANTGGGGGGAPTGGTTSGSGGSGIVIIKYKFQN